MIASFLNYIFGYNETNIYSNNITTNITTNNKIDKLCKKLPYELVNIILEYDGRIKYKYKTKNSIDYHIYVNVIHKHDERYRIITPIIDKKKYITMNTYVSPVDTGFFFEFALDNQPNLFLCYDYNWSYNNLFAICYTDMKCSGHVLGSDQIRTTYI